MVGTQPAHLVSRQHGLVPVVLGAEPPGWRSDLGGRADGAGPIATSARAVAAGVAANGLVRSFSRALRRPMHETRNGRSSGRAAPKPAASGRHDTTPPKPRR